MDGDVLITTGRAGSCLMELSVSPTVGICVFASERRLASPVELQNKGFSLSSTCTPGISETLVFLGMETPE